MLTYSQPAGTLTDASGSLLGTGYSGHPPYVNVASAENLPNQGPCPRGQYTLIPIADGGHLGPCVFRLVAAPSNEMFGRSGFYIHGDDAAMDHTASDGCLIFDRPIRETILSGGDFVLQIV
jgi:hypothetical protein